MIIDLPNEHFLKLIQFYLNKMINLRHLTHYIVLYPQTGDLFMTIDFTLCILHVLGVQVFNSPLFLHPRWGSRVLWCAYLFVYVSVSTHAHPQAYIHNYTYTLSNSFLHATCCRASVFSDGIAICYVLLVLWMTSCLHIMVRMRLCEKGTSKKWFNIRRQDLAAWQILKLVTQVHKCVCINTLM